jgi:hypothetical protein
MYDVIPIPATWRSNHMLWVCMCACVRAFMCTCVWWSVQCVCMCVCTTFGQWTMGVHASNSITYVCWCFPRLKSIFKRSLTFEQASTNLLWSTRFHLVCVCWYRWCNICTSLVSYYLIHTAGMYWIELAVGPGVVLPRRHGDKVNNHSEKREWGCWSVGWLINHVMQHCNALVNGSVHSRVSGKCSARYNPVKKVICPSAYMCLCNTLTSELIFLFRGPSRAKVN